MKTLISYSETRLPRMAGVSFSARMTLDGRLPSKTRCGASSAGVPSASTSARVFPKARA